MLVGALHRLNAESVVLEVFEKHCPWANVKRSYKVRKRSARQVVLNSKEIRWGEIMNVT